MQRSYSLRLASLSVQIGYLRNVLRNIMWAYWDDCALHLFAQVFPLLVCGVCPLSPRVTSLSTLVAMWNNVHMWSVVACAGIYVLARLVLVSFHDVRMLARLVLVSFHDVRMRGARTLQPNIEFDRFLLYVSAYHFMMSCMWCSLVPT